jgi:NAD(P)-dependent dehydrogenase (short-subunit alcohol dehydrogenase family)
MKRYALITGAAGGIGRATTELFAAEGWETIAVDRRESEPFPAGVTSRRTDVAVPAEVESLFAWLEDRTDRLDALINNAAVQICKPMVDLTIEEWDSVMDSNLRSAFLTARLGHRLLRTAGGAIVNISSVHALATSRDIAAYAASKGGLVALTRALALELAPDSIRVNAVLPGAVDTPMLHAGLSRNHVAGDSVEARMADLGSRTVMGRVGKPEEIAQAILFLADGRRSSFVTGQTLVVDGGATARLSTE